MAMNFDNALDFAPYRLSGVVYGVLLNQRAALAALGDAVSQPPYKAPPRAPVLYLKPRNTLNGQGGEVIVPRDVPALEAGGTLALVIAQAASHVTPARALDHVGGYAIVNDFSVPHDNFYRPSVRFKARDSTCCIGPVVARESIADPDALDIRILVDGRPALQADTRSLVRPVRQLLADITEFMTLHPGDLLLVGIPAGVPRVRAGQQVVVEIDGIGRLENTLVAERAA